MRAVLADDEVLARQKLRQVLTGIGDIEVVGECTSAGETITLAQLTKPDLLFLDIRLPDMDAFDMVDALSSVPDARLPQIVFVTANESYALRAFEIHAIDYVLKPYTEDRLRAAVNCARERQFARAFKDREQGSTKQSHQESQKTSEPYATRLIFRSRGRILFLPINEIRWIQAEENYVRIYAGSDSHLLRNAIGHVESRLDPTVFVRVHRSAIVNLHYVKELKNRPGGEASVVLRSGEMIIMSRTYRARFQQLLSL